MQRPTLATRRIFPPIDLFAAGCEASILGGPVDHDVRSHPAVVFSGVRRERAGYLHRGVVASTRGASHLFAGTTRSLGRLGHRIYIPASQAGYNRGAWRTRLSSQRGLELILVDWSAMQTVGVGGMPDEAIDLRAAVNAVSDVVQNRPRPLREFDQIYMKTGDMVLQSEFVAHWADGKSLAFIGDGDAISVCVAYLKNRGILPYGPSKIVVYDFDERIVKAVGRFADRERLESLTAELYNCLDAFPGPTNFDCFYTNPPWGASNEGESVKVFVQRGMEATGYQGEGIAVVADDPELEWPKRVLANLQSSALSCGFFVERMMPQVHSYHLDDAPNLRSCNLILKAVPGNTGPSESLPIRDPERLAHFYGRGLWPRVHYVRERERLDYGKANEHEYALEPLEATDA